MFDVQVDINEVIGEYQARIGQLTHEIIMERLKSSKLEEALMRLHKGETIHTGPSVFDDGEARTTYDGGVQETSFSGGGDTAPSEEAVTHPPEPPREE